MKARLLRWWSSRADEWRPTSEHSRSSAWVRVSQTFARTGRKRMREELGLPLSTAPAPEPGKTIGKTAFFPQIDLPWKREWRFFRPERNRSATSLAWAQIREDEMPPFSDVRYVYDAETLKMMGAAFDTAWQSFSPDLKTHEGARGKLALLILRHMDRGERDATRLSDLALLDFMR